MALKKKEDERRKNLAKSKLKVNDTNVNSVSVGGKKYGFVQMETDGGARSRKQAPVAAAKKKDATQEPDFWKKQQADLEQRIATLKADIEREQSELNRLWSDFYIKNIAAEQEAIRVQIAQLTNQIEQKKAVPQPGRSPAGGPVREGAQGRRPSRLAAMTRAPMPGRDGRQRAPRLPNRRRMVKWRRQWTIATFRNRSCRCSGPRRKSWPGQIGSRVGLIAELGRCTPVGKGKKIRAAFFFLLARLNGARDDGLPTLGAAIEMLHLSSLVHDDIVDHSTCRRGEKTPNHHFGDTLSVLWGDFLFINSIRMLTRDGHAARRCDMLAETSRQMIEGQILEFENNFNYRLRTRGPTTTSSASKTASLFAGIADLAAGLPGGAARRAADFRRFGQDFGMIFQISDDLLDLFSERSGKGRFQDLKEGKVTLPYILLVAGRRPAAHPRLRPLRPASRCWSAAGAWSVRERSLEVIDRYHRRCRGFLRSFPASPCRDSLEGLLEFIRYREY